MKRRTFIQGATLSTATAIVAARGGGKVSAAPVLVGTGCSLCRPDLFPAGMHRFREPLDERHFHAQWMHVGRDWTPPVVTLNGTPVHEVEELYTGTDGWLIREHTTIGESGRKINVLCPCAGLNMQIELWRGDVQQQGIVQFSLEQIRQANSDARARDARWAAIDAFTAQYPGMYEQVWFEQGDHKGEIPVLTRSLIGTGLMDGPYKGWMRTVPTLGWVKQ